MRLKFFAWQGHTFIIRDQVFFPATSWQTRWFFSPTCTISSFYLAVAALVAKSRATLSNPMDCSPPGSSVHGISQARILEWVAISFSRASSRPRNWTCISCVSCIGRKILYHWSPFAFPLPWQVFLCNKHWLTFQTLTQQYLPLCNLLWYYASHSLTTLAVFCLRS